MEDFKEAMGEQNYRILNALPQQSEILAELEQGEARIRRFLKADEAV